MHIFLHTLHLRMKCTISQLRFLKALYITISLIQFTQSYFVINHFICQLFISTANYIIIITHLRFKSTFFLQLFNLIFLIFILNLLLFLPILFIQLVPSSLARPFVFYHFTRFIVGIRFKSALF